MGLLIQKKVFFCENKIIKGVILRSLLFVFSIVFSTIWAQAQHDVNYISQQDKDLTVRRVLVLPVTDNMDGIYARPIEGELKALIDDSHFWDRIQDESVGSLLTPRDLENKPEEVKRIANAADADAIIAARTTRGPNGINIEMSMFLSFDGKLVAQEITRNLKNYQVKELKQKAGAMLYKIKTKLPYNGLILSRRNTKVTLNLGLRDGIKKNDIINVIQIIKLKRHPKFNFIVGAEKEILGKVKVIKVDETISFGAIISEKEKNAIQLYAKLAPGQFINYNSSNAYTNDETGAGDLFSIPGAGAIFGKKPKEWVPTHQPTFGSASLILGLGSFSNNIKLSDDGSGSSASYTGSTSFYTNLGIEGELWITPHWTVGAGIKQGILSVPNPDSGSSPSELNISISKYDLNIAYNVLVLDDFFGPKFELLFGFTNYKSFVDSSNPATLSSTKYSGVNLGLRGSMPLRRRYHLGVELLFFLNSSVNESPAKSGNSTSNSINSYSFFGYYKINQNLRATASLDFEVFTTKFSGAGVGRTATDMSTRFTVANGGIQYLF